MTDRNGDKPTSGGGVATQERPDPLQAISTGTGLDLTQPVSWRSADPQVVDLLEQLQPNIVKGHVREHLSVLFLHFDDEAVARSFLTSVAPLVKSAKRHLLEVDANRSRQDGTTTPEQAAITSTPYIGVGVTAAGYDLLGVPAAQQPDDQAFRRGMRHPETRQGLGDPPVSTWDATFRGPIHAVVLIGDATDAAASRARNAVLALITEGVTVAGEETGLGQRNAGGDGIEHFGYVDGRSQPLFLTEDIDNERLRTDGAKNWDPAFGLDRVLVTDLAAPDPQTHFGSYFVFRKLEQNVARFKQAEEDLADGLGLEGQDRERAGALIVGRFEDGTPITLQRKDGVDAPVPNDFTYDSDEQGMKCPFQAHIRKTNPRGSGGAEDEAGERRHLMARRGQTFGVRLDEVGADLPPSARPTGGVGLLFMAFNTDLGQQFEFTQRIWANNPNFPFVADGIPAPGLDAVIGQGPRVPGSTPAIWSGASGTATAPVAQAVQMRGGEYFFMPSRAFLNSL